MKTFAELFGDRNMGRGGGKACNEDQVRMSVTTETKINPGRQSLGITIGASIMRSARWVTGDKVTIRMDCGNSTILIARVPESSPEVKWTLTGPKRSDKSIGTCCRARFSLNVTPIMLRAFGMYDATEYVPERVETSEHGIRFDLRKP